MKTYIITYQLREVWANYDKFYETLKSTYPDNIHFIETAWVVRTDDSAETITKVLRERMGPRDSIFVAEITDDRDGFVGKGTWEWFGKNTEHKILEKK